MLASTQSFLDQFGIHIELFRHLIIGGLIFTRIFILIMFIPFLGVRPIPGPVRIALTLVLTFLFYFPVATMTPVALPTNGDVILALFLKEVFFAILLGLAAGMVFYGIQAAGNMVDNQRQLANAQIFNPGIGSQASLFGIFYYQFAIVVFLIVGGHHMLFQALAKSFTTVPLLELPKIGPGIGPIFDPHIAFKRRYFCNFLTISRARADRYFYCRCNFRTHESCGTHGECV